MVTNTLKLFTCPDGIKRTRHISMIMIWKWSFCATQTIFAIINAPKELHFPCINLCLKSLSFDRYAFKYPRNLQNTLRRLEIVTIWWSSQYKKFSNAFLHNLSNHFVLTLLTNTQVLHKNHSCHLYSVS